MAFLARSMQDFLGGGPVYLSLVTAPSLEVYITRVLLSYVLYIPIVTLLLYTVSPCYNERPKSEQNAFVSGIAKLSHQRAGGTVHISSEELVWKSFPYCFVGR